MTENRRQILCAACGRLTEMESLCAECETRAMAAQSWPENREKEIDMKCPNCDGDVDATLMNIERSVEEDGIEINFTCPYCRLEQYTVLRPIDFEPVD